MNLKFGRSEASWVVVLRSARAHREAISCGIKSERV